MKKKSRTNLFQPTTKPKRKEKKNKRMEKKMQEPLVLLPWWKRLRSQWIWVLFASLTVVLIVLIIALVCTMCADKRQLRSAARSRQTSRDDSWLRNLKVAVVGKGGGGGGGGVGYDDDDDDGSMPNNRDVRNWLGGLMPSAAAAATTSVAPQRFTRFLVLRNYNNDGGFFWQMYNLLCAAHVAQRNRMALVVLFDTGLYLERDARYLDQYRGVVSPTNWFHSYFEGLAEMQDERILALIRQRSPLVFQAPALELRDGVPVNLSSSSSSSANEVQIREFSRSTFDQRPLDVDYGACWRMAARPRPYIEQKVDVFMRQNRLQGCFLIGIHFRGSDKYESSDDNEDSPVHYEYEWCEQMVRREMAAAAASAASCDYRVLVCSDEQPFVDFMRERLPAERVVYTSAIRSSVNTGGAHLASHLCVSEHDKRPDCVTYRNLKHQSVHRGMPEHSAHQKGEDVLIDVLLLSKCDVFLRSRGNVSNFPGYINSRMRVVDLVDAYRS